ncbi:uncharacterized protein LOC131622474 [Vicia villosa]|uniref:uncharacterized protein LOC131622474 n=1 Tax=Vicia villosa TaxID=3911 RepID=UPI00273BA44E|nr:uncharacterized protein LOC131622474 [Vicia villosa]
MRNVPPLIDLVLTSTTQESVIFALLKHSNGCEVITKSRRLDSIIIVLRRGYSLEARRIAAVLVALAENMDGSRAVLEASSLSSVVEILQSATSCVEKEYYVSVLFSQCANIDGEIVSILVKVGYVIMPFLYAILMDGVPPAEKRKQENLLMCYKNLTRINLWALILHQRLLKSN